jgi:hypothetical protein
MGFGVVCLLYVGFMQAVLALLASNCSMYRQRQDVSSAMQLELLQQVCCCSEPGCFSWKFLLLLVCLDVFISHCQHVALGGIQFIYCLGCTVCAVVTLPCSLQLGGPILCRKAEPGCPAAATIALPSKLLSARAAHLYASVATYLA